MEAAETGEDTSFTSSLLKGRVWKRFLEQHATTAQFERVMQDVQAGRKDPYTAVDELLKAGRLSLREGKGRKH